MYGKIMAFETPSGDTYPNAYWQLYFQNAGPDGVNLVYRVWRDRAAYTAGLPPLPDATGVVPYQLPPAVLAAYPEIGRSIHEAAWAIVKSIKNVGPPPKQLRDPVTTAPLFEADGVTPKMEPDTRQSFFETAVDPAT